MVLCPLCRKVAVFKLCDFGKNCFGVDLLNFEDPRMLNPQSVCVCVSSTLIESLFPIQGTIIFQAQVFRHSSFTWVYALFSDLAHRFIAKSAVGRSQQSSGEMSIDELVDLLC